MRTALLALAATAIIATAASASDGSDTPDNDTQETVRVWTVDHAGKPPFKRRAEELPVTDAPALDSYSDSDAGRDDKSQTRGRPPYNRNR